MKANKKWMIAVFLAAIATAAYAQNAADFNVELTDDGTGVRIKGYTGTATAVRVPETIEDLPVKEIGDGAFMENMALNSSNDKIRSVILPAGLVKIGKRAFGGAENLSSVTIPDSVTEIGDSAFNSTALTQVRLPAGLEKAGENIFASCKSLKTATIPEGVKVIGDYMFGGCSSLTSITIPASVTSIGARAFSYSGLKSLTWPAGAAVIPAEVASNCYYLTTLILPEGLTEIGNEAFGRCSSLATITIPDSVQTLKFGGIPFTGCSKLGIGHRHDLKSLAALAVFRGRKWQSKTRTKSA